MDTHLEDANACYARGVALATEQHYDDAIEQYRKADALWGAAKSNDRKFALWNWGSALYSKGLYQEAAEKFREAITVDADYADAYTGLGAALAAQENYDAAIEQYRKADTLWGAHGCPVEF